MGNKLNCIKNHYSINTSNTAAAAVAEQVCNDRIIITNPLYPDLYNEFKNSPLNNEYCSNKSYKTLFLGASGGGRSVLFRLLANYFSPTQYWTKEQTANVNTIQYIIQLIFIDLYRIALNNGKHVHVSTEESIHNMEKLKFVSETSKNLLANAFILDLNFSDRFSTDLAQAVSEFWLDPIIQEAYQQFHLNSDIPESAEYWLSALNLNRFTNIDYIPSLIDFLHDGTASYSCQQEKLCLGNNSILEIWDLGGRRTQRKRWIHYFENVDVVTYVVNLAEYNLTLYEDSLINRLEESLNLFEQVVTCRYFENTPTVLIFNKAKLFQKKLEKFPLSSYFKEYKADNTYQQCLEWIKQRFITKVTKSQENKITILVMDPLESEFDSNSTQKTATSSISVNNRSITRLNILIDSIPELIPDILRIINSYENYHNEDVFQYMRILNQLLVQKK